MTPPNIRSLAAVLLLVSTACSPSPGGGGTATGGTPGGGAGGASGGSSGGGPAGSSGNDAAAGGGGSAPSGPFAVVTDRYDIARSGSNLRETILNTSNVNTSSFGLLFSRSITGYAFAQPLYVEGLMVGGAVHNVVYVVTEHNWVYAFDADAPTPDAPLWSMNLGSPLTLGVGAAYNPGCTDMRNEVGITSTPVISLADGKIFVVAKVPGDQQLHALDLATGAEAPGSPVSIGQMAGTAFDPQIHLNRPGLLLLKGTIYIAFGSHCDAGAYHGWLYGYDARTLQLTSVYNTTPTGAQGAIWQSGVGLSSDGTDIFATVGNGTSGTGAATDVNMGNSVVRLTPAGAGLTIAAQYQSLVSGDHDLQSGVLLLGDTGQVLAGGKDGAVLLLGQSDLALRGQLSVSGELNSFAFWNGSAGPTAYAWPAAMPLHAYRVSAGSLTPAAINAEKTPLHPSSIFTISSNGTTPGTGILWASMPLAGDAWHATATGALYAFDAADVSKPSLWNSTLVAADDVGTFAKYSPPMVANGKVYLATFSGKLLVYGLK
jgi:hypothetical protein